jgi:hypothetical protein
MIGRHKQHKGVVVNSFCERGGDGGDSGSIARHGLKHDRRSCNAIGRESVFDQRAMRRVAQDNGRCK